MAEILAQLQIDYTLYIQFAVFVAIFLIVPWLFFKPFQRLIEARHQKTVTDRDHAEELVKQANAKLEEFRTRMTEERIRARIEHERVIAEVKAEEAKIVGLARDEAKKITQAALETIQGQTVQLKRSLEADVEGLALQISDMLTKR